MHTLIFSDIHLSPDRTELTQQVCDFLLSQTHQVRHIYILGDIFNTWLGDDVVPEEYTPFINVLQQLTQQGVKLSLMVGNRDFMLGQAFAKSVGAELINDLTYLSIAGKRILLMHGDTLCTDDVSYQRYRRIVRNRFLQWCFRHLPKSYRQNISDKIKQKSREQKAYKSAMIMDVNTEAVTDTFEKTQADIIIHGHTHRPAIHSIHDNEHKTHYRVVLGDWAPEVSYLELSDSQLSLHDSRLPENPSIINLT
jgi:UDP-2,3-diacylglucosamine hydrolase